jgi:hypothetical protein
MCAQEPFIWSVTSMPRAPRERRFLPSSRRSKRVIRRSRGAGDGEGGDCVYVRRDG